MQQVLIGILLVLGIFSYYLYSENVILKANNLALEGAVEMQKEAMEVISQLNPHPGDGIDFSDRDFVIPDVCIENKENEWIVILNDSSLPDARINKYYIELKPMLSSDL